MRLKKEIIAFGVPGIDPAKRTSPKLKPQELKQWLDEGRAVTLLDTRNDYEVKLGTSRTPCPSAWITSDFPAAVAKLPEALKEQPIVMFCTGGIRCERPGRSWRAGFKENLPARRRHPEVFRGMRRRALRRRMFRIRSTRRAGSEFAGDGIHPMFPLPDAVERDRPER